MPFDPIGFIADPAEVEADSKHFDLILKPEHAANLLACAEMLETDEEVRRGWDFDETFHEGACGAIGCAIGWLSYRKRGRSGIGVWQWARDHFGVARHLECESDPVDYLFDVGDGHNLPCDATPDRVARRIRRFVALHTEGCAQ